MRAVDERVANMADVLEAQKQSTLFDVRCAIPAIVVAWDAEQQTVDVQPAIRETVLIDGESEEVEIPLLVDVPVVMPSAGGYGLYFAPSEGDECLVVFADACIDGWWQSGSVQSQLDKRRHDLSDGFAVFGCWSQPNKPTLPESGVSLQNKAGTAGVNIQGNVVNLFGTVRVNGQPI